MLRSLQIWVPAFVLLAAIGIATIAVTLEREPSAALVVDVAGGTGAQPAPEVSETPEPSPAPVVLDVDAVTAATRRPSGVLTYIAGDGEFVSIDAGDPASRPELIEDASTSIGSAHVAGVYPAPNARYVATVRRDETGVWIDITEADQPIEAFQIAGPDDPDLAADKELAAAIDGVPLTIAWSPDSRYLAYGSISANPFSLAIVRSDNWATLTRDVAGGYVGELAWAPDSTRLAISTYELDRRDHTVLMYDPSRQSVQHLIDGCAIVWAPDSTFLAVHREPTVATGVWIASADGDTRIEVIDDAHAFPVDWAERSS